MGFSERYKARFGSCCEGEVFSIHVAEERAGLYHASTATSAEHELHELLHAFVGWIKPERMIETGSYQGQSTIPMADAIVNNGVGRLHSIDIWPENIEAAKKNLDEFDQSLSGVVEFHCGDSRHVIPTLAGPFQMGYFDSGYNADSLGLRIEEISLLVEYGLLDKEFIGIFHDTSRYQSRRVYYLDGLHKFARKNGGHVIETNVSRGCAIIQFRKPKLFV